jgi:hypothetical protein
VCGGCGVETRLRALPRRQIGLIAQWVSRAERSAEKYAADAANVFCILPIDVFKIKV